MTPPTCSHEAEAIVARACTSSKMCFCKAWSRRCPLLSDTDPLVSLTTGRARKSRSTRQKRASVSTGINLRGGAAQHSKMSGTPFCVRVYRREK